MKYNAFISYSSHDTAWGKRLQRRLETYRPPTVLRKKRGWSHHPLQPVFFAPSDIQPGGLSEQIKDRLKESRYLIVICSPSSAKSFWVGEEIRYFLSLGQPDNLLLFIVDGVPGSGNPDTECFHPVLKELGIPEILGTNIHEKAFKTPWLNRERAQAQIISKLLGVDFDTLWDRHRRRMRRRLSLALAGAILAVIAGMLAVRAGEPVDAVLQFRESSTAPASLPALSAVQYSLTLGEDVRTGVSDTALCAVLQNLPRKMIGRTVPITAASPGFLPLDTLVKLSRKTVLSLRRDPDTYGAIRFFLWNPEDETTAPGAEITLDGTPLHADADGTVTLSVPLDLQKPAYPIHSDFLQFADSLVRPSAGDGYVVLFTHRKQP